MAGRPRNPVPDDAPETLAELARDLRELHTRQGRPTFRSLANRSGLGASTIARAFSGRQLPSRDTFLRTLDAIAPSGSLPPAQRTALVEKWHRARADLQRDVEAAPPASDTKPDTVMVHGDRVWLVQVKHTPAAGCEEDDGSRVWVFDADEHRVAAAEVAVATQALDEAMERLERATADVSAARAVLRDATERAAMALHPAKGLLSRDDEAAIQIANGAREDR
ncbi:transcriptional regulator (plasmid) [Streptomyces californicus]|uniref:Transcriptional regulator n=1 Tax=Streptomyces californicus TaxID=67351 RepID=A0ABD7D8E2_9ACTN|nr:MULTISPECIES: transcriptional regulator [Streptomyces]KOU48725.1 hypothetical protein ADK56_21250 [Streptomyces sp. MMG1522]QRV39075.1 transcriptional regulator [Streptomyces californicus]QRV52528.1 transcriptional regulator [Streptomyces californicus]